MAVSGLSDSENECFIRLQELLEEAVQKELKTNNADKQVTVVHHGCIAPTPREYDEVYDSVFISGEKVARDIAKLHDLGITHVINTAQGKRFGQVDTDDKYYKDTGIKYKGIPGHDSVKFDITTYFEEAAEFMKSCDNGKILIHCHQGISRSAAVTIGCLMICKGMSAAEALQHILTKRIVRPNHGFLKKISVYDCKRNAPLNN